MSKYGGPFTVKEVEDVKTFLRLLPLIICAGGCNTGIFLNWYKLLNGEGLLEDSKLSITYSYLSQLIIFALGIPIYHFLLYPLFYNYIPTMLNRIRVGLVLVVLSYCMSAVVGELFVCNSLTNATCLLFHSEIFNVSANGGWWIIGPVTLCHVGYAISVITLFEFVWAQSPRPFCGLLTGITIMSGSLSAFIGYGLQKLVAIVISTAHGWLYSNLSIVCIYIICLYFIIFYCVSKRCKLRKRDDIVPIHLFAEDFDEKEIRGRS